MTIWSPTLAAADGPRYLAIARALARDIDAGRLRSGDRLPTQRELADGLGIAIGTVTRAYAEAERRGLVRGEVGRGTFVGKASSAAGVLGVAQDAALIDLSLNLPVYAEDPDLAAALAKLAKRSDVQELLRYQPHAGMARHREAGARWLARFGLVVEPDRVLVCAGAQHAMTVVFATIAQPGDRILTEALTYPGMKALASVLHLRLEGVAMDAEGIRPDALEEALSHGAARALYCMPTLHNPTAGVLSERRRREIVAIAAAHDLAIVEDDVHRLLVPDPPPPLAARAPERSYYIAGTSKTIAGALRVAFLAAPAAMVEPLARTIWATAWMAAPVNAEIATTWILDGTADRIVARRRREAAVRQRLAQRILGRHTLRTAPHAYHVWLELPDPWRSETFTREARRRGVVVTPAEAFAVGRGAAPDAVRVSLGGAVDRERLETGLAILAQISSGPPTAGPGVV